ncbi:hypothetical protein PX554_07030 [Sphingomonas sp. H39-1-10]|uniref:hypothetical protein n=1 Tax=Sphingomonas TaxID=13687 RepID=UPI00088B0C5A|nr:MULTISPECIES: hypothetical protein [Sphingomonas]MDF0487878.1 hypothetical protein [Sphingomonas pollutisoli]SDA24641.1 hypothetical protein SAMN03159340_01766 [Sphingomonas sp. NFR15]
MPNSVTATGVQNHIIGATFAASTDEIDNKVRQYVAAGALSTKRVTGGKMPMAVIEERQYNNGPEDGVKADQARHWYRAMDKYEFRHLVQNGKLHLTPSDLRPSATQISAEEAVKQAKEKKGKKGANPLKKALNVTVDMPQDNGYLGIAPNASYARKYMGEKKTQNWLVEFIDPDGLIYENLSALKLGNKIATVKGEGGGTFGLGPQGTLAGALCGEEFNKLLIGEATFSEGVAEPRPGAVVWRLIEVRVPIEELGVP